ncbi:MAG: hypothetical protein HY600_01785 [Candidatus Omnitrophica bacterium]|nr:hypothetical protein [Candidatus Omnitrophota bacterium]
MRRGLVWGLVGSIVINLFLVVAVVRFGSQLDEERAQRIDLEIQLDELLAEQEEAWQPATTPPATAPATSDTTTQPATP